MTYEAIAKVNGEITMLDLKGKAYAMVPERVTAFRKLYPEGFILTDITKDDGTIVQMQTKVGYYKENGEPVVLATGYAQEVKGKGMVNGTSHIENCETSSVGRALGMMGLGINGGGICSAEELANAIVAQGQMRKEAAAPDPAPATPEPVEPPASDLPKSDRKINIATACELAKKGGFDNLINEKGYNGKPWDELTDEQIIKVKLWAAQKGKAK